MVAGEWVIFFKVVEVEYFCIVVFLSVLNFLKFFFKSTKFLLNFVIIGELK